MPSCVGSSNLSEAGWSTSLSKQQIVGCVTALARAYQTNNFGENGNHAIAIVNEFLFGALGFAVTHPTK